MASIQPNGDNMPFGPSSRKEAQSDLAASLLMLAHGHKVSVLEAPKVIATYHGKKVVTKVPGATITRHTLGW